MAQNPPIVCYRCEKQVERFRINERADVRQFVIEADCHGETDLEIIDQVGIGGIKYPVVMFKPPEEGVCPAKRLALPEGSL